MIFPVTELISALIDLRVFTEAVWKAMEKFPVKDRNGKDCIDSTR